MKEISFTRLENLIGFGTPDLLAYNKNHTFFTIELKVTKSNSIKFSPHQISFHVRHPKNTFILVSSERDKTEKLYEGSCILQLVACGLKLDACCLTLEDCYKKFQSLQLEACGLLLVAWRLVAWRWWVVARPRVSPGQIQYIMISGHVSVYHMQRF